MYRTLWEKYREKLPSFPQLRRPLIGSVIKEVRIDKGIRQKDFARDIGINESTLKSVENDHQKATTSENLSRMASRLGMSAEDIILIGRERDPANHFVFKKNPPHSIAGIRKRKQFPEEWHGTIRLQFRHFDLIPVSPPIRNQKDFFMAKLTLPPKHRIEGLRLDFSSSVLVFLTNGFNVQVTYRAETHSITANQGFLLDGIHTHTIANEDEEHTAVFYLITRIEPQPFPKTPIITAARSKEFLDIARGIEILRMQKSPRIGKPLPVSHLADLSCSLDHEQISKLMRLKRGSSVIYWEKIEDLLAGCNVTMDKFLSWCRESPDQDFRLIAAPDRAVIDYSAYHGVKIYSVTPPESNLSLFAGEIFVEGQQGIRHKSWSRKDRAMIGLYVEESEIEVRVGRRRSPLTLSKGESIYFDGSLGYTLRNPSGIQAKGFFATFPQIPF